MHLAQAPFCLRKHRSDTLQLARRRSPLLGLLQRQMRLAQALLCQPHPINPDQAVSSCSSGPVAESRGAASSDEPATDTSSGSTAVREVGGLARKGSTLSATGSGNPRCLRRSRTNSPNFLAARASSVCDGRDLHLPHDDSPHGQEARPYAVAPK